MTMYATKNFQTKKALKEAIASGAKISCFAPGLGNVPENGSVTLSGPHYPQPHKWYAEGVMENGYLVKVK